MSPFTPVPIFMLTIMSPYTPVQVFMHKKATPNYSFGIRHSQYMTPLIVDSIDLY